LNHLNKVLNRGGKTAYMNTGDAPFLVDMIERDIIDRKNPVIFDDIASLDDAKRLLNEVSYIPKSTKKSTTCKSVKP
jgi:hypothetical protein